MLYSDLVDLVFWSRLITNAFLVIYELVPIPLLVFTLSRMLI